MDFRGIGAGADPADVLASYFPTDRRSGAGIEAEEAELHVAKVCELLEVSRFAFYDWHKHLPSARQLADGELGERR